MSFASSPKSLIQDPLLSEYISEAYLIIYEEYIKTRLTGVSSGP